MPQTAHAVQEVPAAAYPIEESPQSKSRSTRSRGRRNRELGRRGEDAAARYLYRHGYEIVERNWACCAGEADIIARDGRTVVFVEVKTRRDCDKGFPSEAVTAAKRERYEKIACVFLSNCDLDDVSVRFDVMSIVVVGTDRAFVRHTIDAFSVM